MGREIELKFDLSPQDLQVIREHPLFTGEDGGAARWQQLNAVYFDTADDALRRAGLSLRIRDEGRGRVQTVKSAGGQDGLLARGEWEAPVDGEAPDFASLAQTPVGSMLSHLEAELLPRFETRIERVTRTLCADGVEVEFCLDQGEVATAGRRAPLNQLEIELKHGPPEVLFELARELAETAPVRLSFQTKAQAGYALLDGPKHRALKPEPVRLRDGASAGQAFQTIARACLVQLTGNEARLRETRAPEPLHQMRIAVRRLRAAISAFRRVVDDRRMEVVRGELKWIGGELNAARNLDVFLQETVGPAADRDPQLQGLQDLELEVRRARTLAYDRAITAIDGPRYRRALIDLAAWLETGDWITGEDGSASPLRDTPAAEFAAAALRRRRRKLKAQGKRLRKLDAEGRHELRIAAKKMRYIAEFFANIYERKKAVRRRERFLDAVKALQDRLGELNDIATGPQTAAEILVHGEEPERRARAIFAAGRIVGARMAREAKLIRSAERAYDDFVEAKPFW